MISMIERAKVNLSLKLYARANPFPEVLDDWPSPTVVPLERQYILRMPVKWTTREGLQIPPELDWIASFIQKADEHQQSYFNGRNLRYGYITVRHGVVDSVTDDEWHVDGFSMRQQHYPECNYIWTDSEPTEFKLGTLVVPEDFDPLKHDFNDYINRKYTGYLWKPRERQWVLFDPYCVHRRPPHTTGKKRTFVRITFTVIPITDGLNAWNPLLRGSVPTRTPVNEFKKTLIRYPK